MELQRVQRLARHLQQELHGVHKDIGRVQLLIVGYRGCGFTAGIQLREIGETRTTRCIVQRSLKLVMPIHRVTLCTSGDLMRAVVLLLVLLPLLPLHTVRAQDLSTPPALPSLVTVPPASSAATPSAFDPSVRPRPAEGERDRGRGALYGLAIGALVGGVGFAATNYVFTESTPRNEYTPLSFVLGAAVGGAAGAIVGAIIGAPKQDNAPAQRAQLLFTPDLRGGGAVAVSVSFRSR